VLIVRFLNERRRPPLAAIGGWSAGFCPVVEKLAMRQIDNRLRRLERQPKNAARRVILWDDGSGSAQIEAAALQKEHGENVKIVLVGWLPDASAT
jgi:hypothetical protein